jgi:3-oxo-5-alpha-steroid 4-dehydrogenase 1
MLGAGMFDGVLFYRAVYAGFAAACVALVVQCFIPAPYGRYSRPGWGPALDPRLGWLAMELPAATAVAVLFLTSDRTANLPAIVFLAMWELHYVHRTLVFPFLLRPGTARMPASIPAMGILFNLFNAYLQGGWLFRVSPPYGRTWLGDPRFLAGAALFFGGMAVNWHADAILRRLRRSGETEYKVPEGGLYRWVSCPNYLGEMVEWIGWAVATWSLAGAAFAFWTAANVVPRAVAHHRWYLRRFPEYPKDRHAILPWIA